MTDWNAIREEYLTGAASFRRLGRKYGLSPTTISRHARKAGWTPQQPDLRKDARLQSLFRAADLLLQRLEALIADTSQPLNPKDAKSLSGTLKDLKEVQMLKSDLDCREQEARIEKLRRELEKNDLETKSITIEITGGQTPWAT